jgi:hypothetical protein
MPHPRKRSESRQAAAACSAALLAAVLAGAAGAQSVTLARPDDVRIPKGLNLGETSFYDGLVDTTPGFTLIPYASHQALDEITGPDGRPSPAFNHPKIDVDVVVIQVVYVAREFDHGCVGLTVVQPFIHFDSKFGTPGAALRDNGLGPGDTVIGPFYQSKPVLSGGRPVFYFRAEMDAIVPSGSFDSGKDLNQGSGYASLNPYISFSWLPTPGLEVSGRALYLYNFATSRAPNPASLPGLPFREGQAGQAAWLNFDASYQVAPGVSVGANGYWLTQLTDDRFDGLDVPNSKAEELYIGPGVHWVVSKTNILNFNLYVPASSRNLPQGPKVNVQYIHPF